MTDDKILKIRIFSKIKKSDLPCCLVIILIQIILFCRPNKTLEMHNIIVKVIWSCLGGGGVLYMIEISMLSC